MLSDKLLEDLPEDVVDLWHECEVQILTDIARRINAGNYLIPSSTWKVQKLKDLGLNQDYINSVLAKTTGKSEKEIRLIMAEAFKHGINEDMVIIKNALGDIKYNPGILNPIAEKGIEAVNGIIKNYTKTYAAAVSKTYENAIDLAYMNVQSGFMGHNQAVEYAVKSLFNERDLPALVTKDGRIENVTTVVARAVRTGTNQAMSRIQIANCIDLGCDLVEVTSHMGARPSHAIWQGQIYSLTDKHNKYPNFRTATGFGTGEGLCGWNCRHSFYPFFEGLSTKSAKDIDVERNNRAYEQQQKVRVLKNKLKHLNKKELVYQAGGVDSGEVRKRIKKISSDLTSVYEEIKSEKYDRYYLNLQYFANSGSNQVKNRTLKELAERNFDHSISFGKFEDYGSIKIKLFTKEVIVTNERVMHILENHPELEGITQKEIRDVVKSPNGVLIDDKNKNSYIFTKEVSETSSLAIVVSMVRNLAQYKFGRRNTIITCFKVGTARIRESGNLLIYVNE